MSIQIKTFYCRRCDAMMIHERNSISHVLHLLLSIITAGLWLPVWLLIILFQGAYICRGCVRKHGLLDYGFVRWTIVVVVAVGLIAAVYNYMETLL